MREYKGGLYNSVDKFTHAVGINNSYESNKPKVSKVAGGDSFEAKEKRYNDYNKYLGEEVFDYDGLTEMFEKFNDEFYQKQGKVEVHNINSLVKPNELVDFDFLISSFRKFYFVLNSKPIILDNDEKTNIVLQKIFLKHFINYLTPKLKNVITNKDNYINCEIGVSGIRESRLVLSNTDGILDLKSKESFKVIESFLYNIFDGEFSNSKLNISFCLNEILRSRFLNLLDDNLKELFFMIIFKELSKGTSFLNRGNSDLRIGYVFNNLNSYLQKIQVLASELGYFNKNIINNPKLIFDSNNKENCNLIIQIAKGGLLKNDDTLSRIKYFLEKNLYSITVMFDEIDEQDNLRVIRLKEFLDNYQNDKTYSYKLMKSNTGVNYLKTFDGSSSILLHPKFIIYQKKGILYVNNDCSITSYEKNVKELFHYGKIPKNLLSLFKYSFRAFDLRKSTKLNIVNRFFNK